MSDPSPAARPVVTRIAPSPTGRIHIGNARTALFNWLYARHTGGTFLLRIEDTDRERSTDEAVKIIFDSMKWLGLDYDGEPVFQHTRAERHREAVEKLLETGGAYRDYMSVEELEEERKRARAEGRVIRSPWRDREPRSGANAPFVVRFKSPLEGQTVVNDLVKGPVVFENKALDDLVLLRSDGTPVYNVAVVVDDHDMGVTHVIRGDDHLSNTARQALIFKALGWAQPAYGHLPMIHGPDGAKLSKRHGAQAVHEFREMGYLPEAMRNYLARQGWGHGDDEIFSDAQAIEWFNVTDVGSAPSRLDWAKLGHVNNHYIRQADDQRLLRLVADAHQSRGVTIGERQRAVLLRVIPLVKAGAKTVLELADLTLFALKERPLPLDEKAKALLDAEARERLVRLSIKLADEPEWIAEAMNPALRAFADSEGVGLGKFAQPLRAVLSGGSVAPDLASTLEALGRDESLGRIADALSHVQ